MFTAVAHVETGRASRYLVQLCRHASRMGQHGGHRPGRGRHAPPEVDHVEWSDSRGIIDVGWGRCTVEATPDVLTLRLESADEQGLQRLQAAVAHRLETIGRRESLRVDWQRPGAPAPGPTTRKRRGRVTTIALLAGGVLIVAVHLGLGGTALATSAWTAWATNIFLAVVLLKVLIVAVHVALGRVVLRRVAGDTASPSDRAGDESGSGRRGNDRRNAGEVAFLAPLGRGSGHARWRRPRRTPFRWRHTR